MAVAIKTQFLGPTNHRGARVKATHMLSGASATVSWSYESDIEDNHEYAVLALLRKIGRNDVANPPPKMARAPVNGGGYVYVEVTE